MARNTGELYVECDIFTVEPNRVVEKQKLVQVSIASGHLPVGLDGLFNVYNPLYRTRMLPSTTACPARGSTSVSASSCVYMRMQPNLFYSPRIERIQRDEQHI